MCLEQVECIKNMALQRCGRSELDKLCVLDIFHENIERSEAINIGL